MTKKKVSLKGPKYISELLSFVNPFTKKRQLFHPNKWKAYIMQQGGYKSLIQLQIAYVEAKDQTTKEALELLMLSHHNSEPQ